MSIGPRGVSPAPSLTMPDRRRTNWELSLAGELGDKQSELLDQFVECPIRSQGILWIDSCGGSVYAGVAIASIIKLRGLQVTAVVAGECSSAALLPFGACEKRYVTPHSTLLFHPMRWQSEEDVQLEQATEWARHFRALEEDLDELLAKLLNVSGDQLSKWCRPGRHLTGLEVADAGIAEVVDLFSGTFHQQVAAKRSQ